MNYRIQYTRKAKKERYFLTFLCVRCRIIGAPDSNGWIITVKFSSFVFGKSIFMRHQMETLLKEELRVLAIRTRERLHLTQKEMAKRLEMSESSYSDIETGVFMCGTLTAVLLLSEQETPEIFLQDLKVKFQQQYEKEMQPV